MTNQHRTPDMFSQWQEWNKTNQELWNRTLQSWIETEDFAQMFGKIMENYLVSYNVLVKPAQEYTEQALRMMKIATIDDITRIAEMIVNLENKVDALTDEVAKLSASDSHKETR
jgi:hypothetical protein